MKLNSKTAISAPKVLLVPYESHHVAKYHGWMQDPEIRQATASEALTLEAEYRNQAEWRRARDKLTFIVCKPIDRSLGGHYEVNFLRMNTFDAMDKMVGDVNFFLHPYDGEDDDGDDGDDDKTHGKGAGREDWLTGEVDIMIADEDSRGEGMGRAAVCAMLVYVQVQLGFILEEYVMNRPEGGGPSGAALKRLMVKIKEGNQASRSLFTGLGFRQEGGVNYFGEVKMVMDLADLQRQPWWDQTLSSWIQIPYGSLREELKYL